ncbi:TonB-dependent receptor [Sphingomonas sp. G-3-2-10]|uniref:TonB-dependent receptor plug domain-containing protein n=1 Tax=Sphingomonas sp. G-3-2-10 TaxID=2728838 RepID=UPI00146CEC4F|nr:TonB-dependent receptor [Sphingomonas sp. G-3-2-10]NML07041.1 TonB-dependent receptor [Sphingomonas sp. G-3-2-10]
MKKNLAGHLKLSAAPLAMGFALIAAPAFAQDSAPVDGQAAEEGQEILVTGSRIPQPNLTSTSPVTVINSAEIKLTGTTRAEDLINALPQVFAEFGGNVSNGATGTATVNLRGLGSQRTLVLINGRRLVPGDPSVPSPDLNAIPAALISRVDVLTGGASSVYGADAVGGVVNFVMDTDFTGFKIDGQYSFYQHNNDSKTGIRNALNARGFPYPDGSVTDGGTVDATATIGASFDDGRGHVVGYVGYRKINAVTQDRRDYSACATQARAVPNNSATSLFTCGGSATSPQGSFIVYDGGTSTIFQVGPNRTFIPGSTPYNFAPTNYYQRPDERYTAGFFAKYEISDALQPYLEGMFMDDRSIAQIAPSGNFGNTLSINCNNPLLSAQQLSIVCDNENLLNADGEAIGAPGSAGGPAAVFIDPTTGTTYNRGFLQPLRRNAEGGPRRDDLQHTSYRIVAGMKGNLGNGFSYDSYYMYGRTNFAETYYNDASVSRITKALDVVDDPNQPGINPICRSVLSGEDPNCLPWDIFAATGPSAGSVNYITIPGFQRGNTEETVASFSVTALLGEHGVKTPWANGGLAVNLGFEYRKEALELNTDIAFQTGDLAGQGAATLPVTGSFNVKEFFFEGRMPLVQDGFIADLSIEGGYRYSDYDIAGRSFQTDTYKLAAEFAPVRDIRFRAAYNRAVRSPNIQELFAPRRVALNGNGDPCAGTAADILASGVTQLQCANTGVSAAQFGTIAGNPAGQYNGLIGGNPNLTPEIADTYTVGVVFQPTFVRNFALTVDYFDITVDNTVANIGQDTIIETCLRTGDASFCNLINRDQFGSLWRTPGGYVTDTTQNVGSLKTTGVDIGLSYSHELGSMGSLALNVNGTYLDSLVTNNGVSAPYDCTGLYGLQCGTPTPEWRHKARLTYTSPWGVGLSLGWRYFDAVSIDRSSTNPTLTGAFAPLNAKIPSQSYLDLSLSATVGKHYSFRLGVQNLLDKEPPIIGANGTSAVINACASVYCNGNTYPVVYDALGRYIYAGVTLDF